MLMKAIIATKYGGPSVLTLAEVEKPMPKENEVLVKIHSATVSAGDCEVRGSKFPLLLKLAMRVAFGVFKPRKGTVYGQEFSGHVEEVGESVTKFQVGDQVFGPTDFSFGAYAEYICVSEDAPMVLKPENMTFEEAAAVPVGGLNALAFIRSAQLSEGDKLLINGAGGSIGTIAVQLAKLLGAEVTVVDSQDKLEMLLELGADHVVDYQEEDFTTLGQRYDAIIDVIGKSDYAKTINCLEETGFYILGGLQFGSIIKGKMESSKTVKYVTAGYSTDDLEYLKGLIENDELHTAIDRTYALEDIVQAHEYVETGQKKGNVIIAVDEFSSEYNYHID